MDLNLLEYLVALDDERSVSRAAERLGVNQPRVSVALAKLREALGDPLFVRTSRGMIPTARGLTLAGSAREALALIRAGVLDAPAFAPAQSTRTFNVALSDVGEIVFLPRLVQRLAECAPRAALRSVSLAPEQIEHGLATGGVDLAVGYFPDLAKTDIVSQRIFTHHFVCLIRSDHPAAKGPMTVERFFRLGHAAVRAEGRSQEIFEAFLARKRLRRRIVLETPHFTSLPFILARTDLIATVPHAIGYAYAREHANLTLLAPPFKLPRFDLAQHWHRRFHDDAPVAWLRAQVAELFNDAADEWPH